MPLTTADPRPGATTAATLTTATAPTGSAARTVDLVKVYGSGPAVVRALDGVTVDFAAGRFTAIMGPSGSGKSTLMHCVAGLDTPTSGQVFLGDTELTRMSDKAITLTRRKRVGFVFQAVTVRVVKEPFASVMAASSDLTAAGATQQTGSLLVRLADGGDPGAVLDRLIATLSGVTGVSVDGAAPRRVEFQGIVDVVLLIVTGLLAVAVLIALVGVGNTLALSVLERGRESALLRALGLTRGQLRGSLAIEAALLALVGALTGTLLGVGYGYDGATALLGSIAPVPLVIPWGRLALVVVVALVAGVAAAWPPSRRAARVAPAAALALE